MEIRKRKKPLKKVSVLLLIIFSFFMVILIGAGLLALPIFHKGEGMNFVDALFTSVSAVCVTGLCPVPDVGPDTQMPRPVIGKTAVVRFNFRPGKHQEGIAVQRKQPLPDQHVEHLFFIE